MHFQRSQFMATGVLLRVLLVGCDSSDSPSAAPQPPLVEPPPAAPAPAPPPETGALPPLARTVTDISNGPDIGAAYWPSGNTSSGGSGQEVQGVPCTAPDETFHEHSHLSIFLNGAPLAVPNDIGIVAQSPTSNCYYRLHTHDLSGKIHAEGPTPRVFTLGQFFGIWGQPLERTNVGGHAGLPVVAYITDDGVASLYDGELAAIELKSRREITLQISTPITEIPRYTWAGD